MPVVWFFASGDNPQQDGIGRWLEFRQLSEAENFSYPEKREKLRPVGRSFFCGQVTRLGVRIQ